MNHVITAGSFDILHNGHKALLDRAFEIGDKISIGVASDKFIQRFKLHKPYYPFNTRQQEVFKYVSKFKKPFEFFHFDTIYGDTISNFNYTHLVVAEESLHNAKEINKRRETNLHIEVVDMVFDELGEHVISSEKIKAGILDTDGKVFFSKNYIHTLTISKEQKEALQSEIWGTLHAFIKTRCTRAIAVGDATCKKFRLKNLFAYTYDNVLKRIPVDEKNKFIPDTHYPKFQVNNPPSTITIELQEIIYNNITKPFALEVDGEEDLASMAFLLEYPLDTCIYYGLPGKGLVELPCSLEWKRKAYKLIYGKQRS